MTGILERAIQAYRKGGITSLISKISTRSMRSLQSFALYFRWLFFRWKTIGALKNHTTEHSNEEETAVLRQKENSLHKAIQSFAKRDILEVGIGDTPSLDRIKMISNMGLNYTGCDFIRVCTNHERLINKAGLNNPRISFLGNSYGTYTWTMFELVQKSKKFDFIYLDGHHTFYVDLPAVYLAHELLDAGAYLFIDDIKWSLSFLKNNMCRSFGEWRYYHNIYDFGVYSREQQDLMHIGIIVKEILINKLKYRLVEDYSAKEWCLLQKPS